MEEVRNAAQIELTEEQLEKVDRFRRSKETAVLVVMFTDMKGSTEIAEQKGEQYAEQMRRTHNQMLLEIIEKDGNGLCIKTIGDSLMSIFAEPSVAVERALEIQERLHHYNQEYPEEEDVVVRIGMHMGQVSIEDKTQMDVFGRHVNRAARVENLADGGHIYLTHAVYDSARGWLRGENLDWRNHGEYQVKGIAEPIRIYEVVDRAITSPKGPGIKRAWSKFRKLSAVACLICLPILAYGSIPKVYIEEPLMLREYIISRDQVVLIPLREKLRIVNKALVRFVNPTVSYLPSNHGIYSISPSSILLTGSENFFNIRPLSDNLPTKIDKVHTICDSISVSVLGREIARLPVEVVVSDTRELNSIISIKPDSLNLSRENRSKILTISNADSMLSVKLKVEKINWLSISPDTLSINFSQQGTLVAKLIREELDEQKKIKIMIESVTPRNGAPITLGLSFHDIGLLVQVMEQPPSEISQLPKGELPKKTEISVPEDTSAVLEKELQQTEEKEVIPHALLVAYLDLFTYSRYENIEVEPIKSDKCKVEFVEEYEQDDGKYHYKFFVNFVSESDSSRNAYISLRISINHEFIKEECWLFTAGETLKQDLDKF